jgi:hypothetical protein
MNTATVTVVPTLTGTDSLHELFEQLRYVLSGEAKVDSGLLVNGKPFRGFQGYQDGTLPVLLRGELSEVTANLRSPQSLDVSLRPRDPLDAHHVAACESAALAFVYLLRAACPGAVSAVAIHPTSSASAHIHQYLEA